MSEKIEDTTNNYTLYIYICSVKFIKPVECVDANHETVVGFKFLKKIEFEVHKINETHLKKGCIPCSCAVKFDKGKCCMFKMDNRDLKKESKDQIMMNVEVFQKLQCSCLPSRLEVGKTSVDIRPLISKAYNREESRSEKKTYELKNDKSEITALMDMALFITKLDSVIVNDFVVTEEGNVLCGGDDKTGADVAKENMFKLEKNLTELTKIANMPVDGSCSNAPMCPPVSGASTPSHIPVPTAPYGVERHAAACPCKDTTTTSQVIAELVKEELKELPSPSQEFFKTNEYLCEEISAVMNGNAVRIRIPRKKKDPKEMEKAKDDKGIKTDDTKHDPFSTPENPERTMLFGENEIVMSMRQKGEEEEDRQSGFKTTYTTGELYAGKPTVDIRPANIPGSVKALKVIEPEKDIFLLKINKKCDPKAKAALELELATPRPPLKPSRPFQETRSTQYDPNDCPPPTPPPEPEPEPEPAPPPPPPPKKGKSKGKGKGGKGKGKGKKK